MFSKHYFYMHGDILEGGNSRVYAIAKLVAQTGATQFKYSSRNRAHRLADGVHFLVSLLLNSNQTILIHYSLFDTLFSKRIVSIKFVARILGWIIETAAKKNVVYLEVNDLPYEQAIDLELKPNKMNVFDAAVLTIPSVKYIFPTTEIAKYAKSKYKINESHISVLINGSWISDACNKTSIEAKLPNRGLKFVYAGTLNKGRQISELIKIFSDSEQSLVLIGSDGDWIAEEYRNKENIKYLGPMPELYAQDVVKQCDMGVIPYDSSRMYYNQCFPTKASFYITSGIPFLSTPLVELKKHFTDEVVVYCELNDWGKVLADENLISVIEERRNNIDGEFRQKFSWPFIWQRWLREQICENKNHIPSTRAQQAK